MIVVNQPDKYCRTQTNSCNIYFACKNFSAVPPLGGGGVDHVYSWSDKL